MAAAPPFPASLPILSPARDEPSSVMPTVLLPPPIRNVPAAFTSAVVDARSKGLREAPFTWTGSEFTSVLDTDVDTLAFSVCTNCAAAVTSTLCWVWPTCRVTSTRTVPPATTTTLSVIFVLKLGLSGSDLIRTNRQRGDREIARRAGRSFERRVRLFLNDSDGCPGHDGPAGVRYGSRNHAAVTLPRQSRRQYARQQNQTDEKRPRSLSHLAIPPYGPDCQFGGSPGSVSLQRNGHVAHCDSAAGPCVIYIEDFVLCKSLL